MRYQHLSYLILGLTLLLQTPLGAQGVVSEAAVDKVFERWNTSETPGCAVAVGKDGRTLVRRAYGMADLERGIPNSPATIFEAGSVSKQFTAAAVILLSEMGRLSLDDDVRRHIPELPEYGAPITIRHLIHHTSGLRDWGTIATISGWPRSRRAHTNAHALEIIARQTALNYEPGTAYSYTNSGYTLLTLIVERVTGESLQSFTRKTFFEPLGMKNTAWRMDHTRIVPGRALAYRQVRNGFRNAMPNEDVYGHAALLTTVEDLLIWNENLNTGKVGGEGFVREMHRAARLNDGKEVPYAGGLRLEKYRGLDEVGHGGSTAGYQTYLTRFPGQNLSIAVLCNSTGTGPRRLAYRTADLFLDGLPGVASAPRRGSASGSRADEARSTYIPTAEELASYVGEYNSEEAEVKYRVVVEGDRVELHRSPATVYRLTPTGRDAFRASNGWTIKFSRNAQGEVTLMTLGTSRVWNLVFVKGSNW